MGHCKDYGLRSNGVTAESEKNDNMGLTFQLDHFGSFIDLGLGGSGVNGAAKT